LGLYRSFQVIHALMTDLVSFVLPAIIPAAEILVIATCFTVIRLLPSFDLGMLFTVVIVGALTLLILNLAITFAVNVTEASKGFLEIGRRVDVKSPKYLQLYLDSCQPLTWPIGHTFILNRETFPRIVDGIILNILINLLILF